MRSLDGTSEHPPKVLHDARADALEERTRERMPFLWAQTQENMAIAYHSMFEKTGDVGTLDTAARHVADALIVCREAQADHYIAKGERLRGEIARQREAVAARAS